MHIVVMEVFDHHAIREENMNNQIKNSCWISGSENRPEYFSSSGVTYDKQCVGGCRTGSVTQINGNSYVQYDPEIGVCGRSRIRAGYIMRAENAQAVIFQADFFNAEGARVQTQTMDVTDRICCQFACLTVCFNIPCTAQSVQLSVRFRGKVTACTFYAPTAYFV